MIIIKKDKGSVKFVYMYFNPNLANLSPNLANLSPNFGNSYTQHEHERQLA